MLIRSLNGTSREIANLSGANLRRADLRRADLRGADLSGANLRGADLSGANLNSADLSGANLNSADLSGADLSGANLGGADLGGANLNSANLNSANLNSANLSDANLICADLRGANLRGADLKDCKGLEQQCILPEGQIIGYKKLEDGSIAKLRIAASVKRINAYGSRECRAESAFVLSSTGSRAKRDGMPYPKRGKVTPDKYDPDPRVECSHGIHFFITEQEAKDCA